MNLTTKSPCIGVCEYAEITEGELERTCKGCSRTAEEIEEWFLATEERRKEIVNNCKKRKLDEDCKKEVASISRIFKVVNNK
jgi:predicted Fe-S protein YdhL (DUF1289 family)